MDTETSSIVSKISLLTGVENWGAWKFKIKVLIQARDALDVVLGDTPKPELASGADATATAAYTASLKTWRKLDGIAQQLIVTTVSEQTVLHIMNCQSSKEMWDKLHEIYENKSSTMKHFLMQQWYSLNKDAADDLATHIAKIDDLACRLKALGETVSDEMIITKIMMTLPPSYMHFNTAWESTSLTDRTLTNLKSRLAVEELRMNSQGNQMQNAFSAASKNKQYAKGSYKNKKLPGKCHRCGKPGHWKKSCYTKLDEDNKDENNPKRGSAMIGEIIAVNALISEKVTDEWFMDSGATQHMSPVLEWFVNYKPLITQIPIQMGNGDIIYATGEGEIDIYAFNGSEWNRQYLAKVLHVPELKYNLFSLSSALDKGLSLSSHSQKCTFSKNGNVLAVGERQGKLYRMIFRPELQEQGILATSKPVERACVSVNKFDSLRIWHERLAHQNVPHILALMKKWNINTHSTWDRVCEGCIVGKMCRKPFHESQSQTHKPGDLIHGDLCGPMEYPSIGNSRYFLLLKDDYSHYRKVYFLKYKSEVPEHFEPFLRYAENELGAKILVFRSDFGGEFTSGPMQEIMRKNGIKHEKSVPYCHEQNGAIERENRTVVEAARSMLYAKNMDLRLWAEAVHTAVYILNRTGTSSVPGKTPFELWHGKSATNLNFKVFGTEVFCHIPKEKRKKWSPKAEKGFFVGYDEHSKGYRIWFPCKGKVEIRRDVFFCTEENIPVVTQDGQKKNYADFKIFEVAEAETPEHPQQPMPEQEDGVQLEENQVPAQDGQQPEAPREQEVGAEERQGQHPQVQGQQEVGGGERQLRDRHSIRKPERYTDYILDVDQVLLAESHDPLTFEEANQAQEKEFWTEAMNDEMDSLRKSQTWLLVTPPEDAQILKNRWVFKYKPKTEKQKARFRARLVVKGFQQRPGIDYGEIFSPVVKFPSIRAILAIAGATNMHLAQFDIKTAFLNGELSEEIYMEQPEGFDDGSGRACKLLKSLYGLKQSARCWNEKFTQCLKDFNLKATEADPCVFTDISNEEKFILALYIDDGMIASTNKDKIKSFLDYLANEFEITVSPLDTFLGVQIKRHADGSLFINQSRYIEKLIKRFRLEEAHDVAIPADQHQDLSLWAPNDGEVVHVPYKEAVGSLLFLTTVSRPDIAFAVNAVSQHAESPKKVHWNAVKRILKYVKGTADQGITFGKNNSMKLIAYSDADFAGDKTTRKSTTGFVIQLGEAPIVWGSQKQKMVSTSTTESEYVAGSETVKELIWIKRLLNSLIKIETPVLYMDNKSAIKLIKNPEYHRRTKHIDVKYHFIRHHYEEKDFQLRYVASGNQVADICTKPLAKRRFEDLRLMMGISEEVFK